MHRASGWSWTHIIVEFGGTFQGRPSVHGAKVKDAVKHRAETCTQHGHITST